MKALRHLARSAAGPALLAISFATGLAATHAAPPGVQPSPTVKWHVWPRGDAINVKVVGNHACVVIGESGLAVIDVSDPATIPGVAIADEELAEEPAVWRS